MGWHRCLPTETHRDWERFSGYFAATVLSKRRFGGPTALGSLHTNSLNMAKNTSLAGSAGGMETVFAASNMDSGHYSQSPGASVSISIFIIGHEQS